MSEAMKEHDGTKNRRFKPYPSYKGSGVEWLGDIPAHWESCALGRAFGVQGGFAFRSEDFVADGIPVVRMSNLKAGQIDLNQAVRIPETLASEAFALRAGDLLVGMSGSISNYAWLTELDVPCQLNQRVGRVYERSGSGYLRFAMYVLGSLPAIYQVDLLAAGTAQQNISAWQLEHIRLTLPPRGEQRAIAAFLDRETAEVDALVAKKERLIEQLHERRSALITRTVTKGLDQNVPTKDSGVEWLGEIPVHWEVKRLKYLGDAIIGLTYEPSDVVGTDDEGVLVLRASNVKDGHIALEDNVFVRCAIPDRLRTKPGDILICSRSGSRALIGKSAKIDGTTVGLTFGTFMTVFRSVCNDYLFYVFNSMLFEYQSGAFLTSTINQLTVNNLKDFTVPVPPDGEQSAITNFLGRETAKIDALVTTVSDAIGRLKELRTSLISAAVTGKIDVREEAA